MPSELQGVATTMPPFPRDFLGETARVLYTFSRHRGLASLAGARPHDLTRQPTTKHYSYHTLRSLADGSHNSHEVCVRRVSDKLVGVAPRVVLVSGVLGAGAMYREA